ncbi:MAG: hypothetical protein NTX65_01145 [Ignavibacteriales bacterium]|nr:hypothetical protein [Ignavibacteriales bacterium]
MKVFQKEIYLDIASVYLLVLIIINILLTKLPLTGTIGFEFAAINGILLFLFGGLTAQSKFKKNSYKSFLELLNNNKILFLSFLLLPFLISLIPSLFISKCPIIDGVLFFFVITIPSFIFGLVTGYFSFSVTPKYALFFFLVLFFVILLSSLVEFFLNPQIYFYNPIFGFYPGTIYDEDLSVDKLLIGYRICNIIFFVAMVLIAKRISSKVFFKRILISSSLLIIVIAFIFLKPILHFATDKNRLDRNLSKSITTEHFHVHLPDSLKNKEAIFAALLNEYYFDQLTIELKFHTDKQKIDSYIFSNRDQKRELLGSGNADIAKPWLNQIYLNFSNYEGSLKHELAHVIAARSGKNILKVAENFNPSMIEGFAMAFEDNYNGNPVHYMAKLANQAGYKISIEKLFEGLNFFSKNSSISYIYCGSFIKYLVDKYGVEKIKTLYSNTDFTMIYGKNLSALVVEYNDFLKIYQINVNNSKAQLYFGGTTIFKKFCPRVAGAEVKKAWNLFNTKRISDALNLFQKVYSYSNSYQSLIGIIACYSKEKKYSEAEKVLNEQLVNFKKSQYFFYLELALGDLFIETNRKSDAVAVYDSLLKQNPHVDYTNEVLIRKSILEDGTDSLKSFFDKNEIMKYETLLRHNEKGIKYYSIPSLLRLAERSNQDIIKLISDLRNKLQVTDYVSSYAALKISMSALKNLDYGQAQYFAVHSFDFKKDENSNHQFVENLRMVNWFKNNADGIKKFSNE